MTSSCATSISICSVLRGSALHQRLKDREIEEAADERDRQKEVEQIETARRKLIEEGDTNAESIILQMEQKMQEHLRRRLNIEEGGSTRADGTPQSTTPSDDHHMETTHQSDAAAQQVRVRNIAFTHPETSL